MAGRRGRSGGANRIDPRTHLLRGTFRPERHQAALDALQSGGKIWEPTERQLEALRIGIDGRAFIGRLRAHYDLVPWEGELMIQAAVIIDRLEQLRVARGGADAKTLLAFDKDEQLWMKTFAGLMQALRLRV